jgi:hypothetical protein
VFAARRVALGVICAAFSLSVVGGAGARELPTPPLPFAAGGWDVTSMARDLAAFSAAGNAVSLLPRTPFQILYVDEATGSVTATPNGGLEAEGGNTFTVAHGRQFFAPVFYLDDSPPVLGTFPGSYPGGLRYFFAPDQVGGRDFAVTIDGRRYPVGPLYLSRPVTTPALSDGGGTHFLLLGAFLAALAPGRHTVAVSGGVYGALVESTYGIAYEHEDLTYTVTVLK